MSKQGVCQVEPLYDVEECQDLRFALRIDSYRYQCRLGSSLPSAEPYSLPDRQLCGRRVYSLNDSLPSPLV